MDESPLLIWFRNDLRVSDHPALSAAAKTGQPVIALYVLDDGGDRPLGAASRWWLAGSLRAHTKKLKYLGIELMLRRGDAKKIVPALVRNEKISRVHWTRRYGCAEKTDRAIATKLREDVIDVHVYGGSLLHEPEDIYTKAGGPMKVFTPFMRAAREKGDPKPPMRAPQKMKSLRGVKSDKLENWDLEPSKPNWAKEINKVWTPGEDGAHDRLYDFLDHGVKGYATGRDRPDQEHISRLSPHLRFGEISPRQIWHAAYGALERKQPPASRDIEKFISEIYWREFSYYLLHHFPDFATRNFQPRYDKFPWRKDTKALKAWQRGETGYPMVDAGMRQLWRTGWMHNRVRMIVASFLVKHLLLDWREGERWFWDTLVDADPANNTSSWQWVAGSGADAAPYFRIFNPTTQGEKFDPQGKYIREYVPELAKLPDNEIQEPWKASADVLKSAKIEIRKDYPKPIVDHAAARARALEAFDETKE
jgi:deoxyribodipyrimidine photo-lyase